MGQQREHLDVLVVGAGLSGIGAACHLATECPDRSFAVLEARAASGGTWDLFRYPGVRSDSDMHTLGYRFRPWQDATVIADGASILAYLRETAREYRVEERIRYHRRVTHAAWSSALSCWTVDVEHTGGPPGRPARTEQLTCDFLFANTGYYRYDEGWTPQFPGVGNFAGRIVHPQHWPSDLDVTGRRVVVIGSGATAVTLVPALAADAAHVTMLQRSPGYVLSLSRRDPLARLLAHVLPPRPAARAIRRKNILLALATYRFSRRAPRTAARLLRRGVRRRLPAGYDVARHFTPRYRPWDQRLCIVPDGDLFRAVSEGRASVVTDRVDRFLEKGLRLASGEELEADVVVTATGLNLQALGGMSLEVDGTAVDVSQCVAYKGVMLSGLPNLAVTLGYTNASWTLKAELTASWVCRLLNHLRSHGHRSATPRAPDPSLPTRPFVDLNAGYVRRAEGALPRQGVTAPWRSQAGYPRDVLALRHGPIEDDALEFAGP